MAQIPVIDLFAGPGVLTVGPAAPSTDVMLLIW